MIDSNQCKYNLFYYDGDMKFHIKENEGDMI